MLFFLKCDLILLVTALAPLVQVSNRTREQVIADIKQAPMSNEDEVETRQLHGPALSHRFRPLLRCRMVYALGCRPDATRCS